MFPGQNPRPQRPSQFHTNGIAPSAPLQIMGNPGSFMQNPMQLQPQMAIPNINSNTQFSPQQLFAFQMNQMNNVNSQHPKGQVLAQNVVNPPQFLNQNVAMQNLNQLLQLQMAMQMPGFAQLVPGNVPLYPNQVSQGIGLQNPNFAMNGHLGLMNASGTVQQSMNGNLSKQMANATRQLQGQSPLMNSFGTVQQPQTQNFSVPASANLQVSQGMRPQSSNFVMNAHMGPVNANGVVQQSKNGFPKQMSNVTQQLQGQLPLMNPFGFVQQPQAQNFNTPASANTQANPEGVGGLNKSIGNQQNSYNSNFSRNQKHGAKSMKSQFGKGKFSPHSKSLEKGHHRKGEKKSFLANSVKPEMEKKRSLLVTYSAQEIRRWREERRKNYPSKSNLEKKPAEKRAETDDSSSAAKLRRQQLKEILAKQAELGCEVAEIPSSYLSDSEKQGDGREQKRPLSRKERFQKKFNKRERFNRNDRFSKKRRFGNSDSSITRDQNASTAGQVTETAREPTLLQKLLSSDIRRDKRHLLQVFRFMTMNSFFKDWPEKPLRFPQVILKETGQEIEAAEEIYDAIDATVEKSANDSDNDEENNIPEFAEAVSELQENSSNSESVKLEGQITN
uniref:Mediator of RNA polymerase II transcription subunit 15 isoform X2 n=1 Tax=Nicotiana tabacum TaxID=4097 RepID=A0A1S4CD51_TOBAC|nr:PREDICTED: mediator of RNA polymerase II transcription subunit 15-like isoform X2 [Nicotiana tabacum]